MPVAGHIAALPAHASPGMVEARGSRGSADASSAVSGPDSVQDFGKLFREQAGEQSGGHPGPVGAEAKGGGNAGSPMPDGNAGSGLAQGLLPDPSSGSPSVLASGLSAEEQPTSGQAQSASGESVPPDSAAALRAQLPGELRGTGAASGAALNADSVDMAGKQGTAVTAGGTAVGTNGGASAGKKAGSSGRSADRAKDGTAAAVKADQNVTAAALPTLVAIAAAPVATPLTASSGSGAVKTKTATVAASPQKFVSASAPANNNAAASVPTEKIKIAAGDQSGAPGVSSSEAPSPGALKVAVSKGDAGGTIPAPLDDANSLKQATGETSKVPADSASAGQHGAPAQHAAIGASAIASSFAASASAHVADAGAQRVDQPASTTPAPAFAASSAPGAGQASGSGAVPNAYDRIDQGAMPVMLHSASQHVSVGVQDPNLGWVEIKTQNLAGHVDATLVTASGQSHDALTAQLPAMAQFLEQRDVRVGSLAVHHEMLGGQNSAGGNAFGNGAGGGAGYGGGAPHSGGEGRAQYTGLSPGLLRPSAVLGAGASGAGASDDSVFRPISYISVRA